VPEEFTAARNARAKAMKSDDDELARRIGALRRPSPAAWIVNRLVREQPDALDELLDLGAELRDAQASGDGRALTRLGRERRTLVSSLLGQADALADVADRSPSRAVLDEVEQTLIAGTVDADAEGALRTGRLVRGLQAVGLEPVDLDGAVAGEASAAPVTRRAARPAKGATSARTDAAGTAETAADEEAAARAERERERERTDAVALEARQLAETADRDLAEAEDLLHGAQERADRLRRERDELETRLRELRSEITAAEREEREAERARTRAATAADRARDAAVEAQAVRERLD
jgi:hypothetical protein